MIHIRDASTADAPTLVAFNAALASETEAKTLDRKVLTGGVERVLRDPALGRYFVACTRDAIVGQTLITTEWSDWRNGLWWWIQSVYVVPGARRTGVFRALHGHIRALAEADPQVCGLRLYVERANRRAMHTYDALDLSDAGYVLYEQTFARSGV